MVAVDSFAAATTHRFGQGQVTYVGTQIAAEA